MPLRIIFLTLFGARGAQFGLGAKPGATALHGSRRVGSRKDADLSAVRLLEKTLCSETTSGMVPWGFLSGRQALPRTGSPGHPWTDGRELTGTVTRAQASAACVGADTLVRRLSRRFCVMGEPAMSVTAKFQDLNSKSTSKAVDKSVRPTRAML